MELEAGKPGGKRLSTMTHAKLRASQGDLSTARRMLEAILRERPDNAEARALLGTISPVADRAHAEPQEEALAPPEAALGEDLASRFREALAAPPGKDRVGRRRKLEDLLRRIEEVREAGRAR